MKGELKANIFGWLQDVNCKSKAICWKTSFLMQINKGLVEVFCRLVLGAYVFKTTKHQNLLTAIGKTS